MGGGWGVVSYPDPYVRNDDHRLQYVMSHTVSDDHRYVHMGLGTRLVGGGGGGGGELLSASEQTQYEKWRPFNCLA